jgi:hypothetical protein
MADNPRDPFERGGVDTVRILAIAGGLLIFLGISMSALAWAYFAIVPAEAIAPAHLPTPEVRPDERQQIHISLEQQRRRLNQGAIPIDRAMAAIAAKGAHAYDPIAPTGQEKP